MKLYQSIGPNPRVVLMYLAETGITLDRQFVDILALENRQPDFYAKSPLGFTPALELDDGRFISESVAICEYLDETRASQRLVGATAEERAQTRMLMRIIDQHVIVFMTAGFRAAEGYPMFKDRLLCLPDAGDDLKRAAADGLAKLDEIIGAGPWVAGDRFSLADILLFCFVEFGGAIGQPTDPALANLAAWRARVAARPSAADSENPKQGLGVS